MSGNITGLDDAGKVLANEAKSSSSMLIPQLTSSASPLLGGYQLIPLKTPLETQSQEHTIEVFITAVPVKKASGTLDLVKKLIPGDGGLDLQHLRRFVKFKDVPQNIRDAFSIAQSLFTSSESLSLPDTAPSLFLLIGSTNAISSSDITEQLSPILSTNPPVFSVQVPLKAPTSQEQAIKWTALYWPTVYKKSNPFGPHPSLVSRAQEEMDVDREVGKWMGLAWAVAREADEEGVGEGVGAVVVERKDGKGRVVAIAGDGRWAGKVWCKGIGSGNVTAHAAMRAIGMVAKGLADRDGEEKEEVLDMEKEVEVAVVGEILESSNLISEDDAMAMPQNVPETGEYQPSLPFPTPSTETVGERATLPPSFNLEIFQDDPLLSLEHQYHSSSPPVNGYLCHDLEIYLTHEPCVLCSMAVIHSRFGRIIFEKRMNQTGGLCADEKSELGLGLFGKKELNWTALAWEFRRSNPSEMDGRTEILEDSGDGLDSMHA